jgi:hypothetical protein
MTTSMHFAAKRSSAIAAAVCVLVLSSPLAVHAGGDQLRGAPADREVVVPPAVRQVTQPANGSGEGAYRTPAVDPRARMRTASVAPAKKGR